MDPTVTGRLDAAQLYRACDLGELKFTTTADIDAPDEVVGQDRAVDAMQFGFGIRRSGYNLFALGPPGTGRHSLIRDFARRQAAGQAAPDDWCYLFNFDTPHQPKALRLQSGTGCRFAADVAQVIDDLGHALPMAFESDDYRVRSEAIEAETHEHQEQALAGLHQQAESHSMGLFKTPSGFTLGPTKDAKPMAPDEFEALPDAEKERIKEASDALQEELKRILHQVPQWEKEARRKREALNREIAAGVAGQLMDALREGYREVDAVLQYLDAMQADLVENYRHFLPQQPSGPSMLGADSDADTPWFNRYRVNSFLAHERNGGAPVVYEDHPTFAKLFGRIEHVARQGTLVTDFTMIHPGALHRANGGYLLLDALEVLSQPFAWAALKRTLKAGEVRIESLAQEISLISTVSLQPEPIPLDLKVVLVGEPMLYYLLSDYDPEFGSLFKVQVDFGTDIDRSGPNEQRFARLIATLARRDALLPFARDAVARLIEQASRRAWDQTRLSADMRRLSDLLQESDYWARRRDADRVAVQDVERAIAAATRRADRLRERLQAETERGTLLIDTDGQRIGQVNGLSVLTLGDFSFGRPSRITARVRVGDGSVVDIEREVEMGGPIHSKGVLILSNFVAGRYALDRPLSLSASLAFEQSYGGVEGDSASCAELYALLSALAELPIKQGLAVTGSVNQHGEVQAIGGVNEKVEGFFDLCNARGLSGDQGVLIPAANVQHLMLRQDVVQAVADRRFAVYAVADIDQGIELLTGIEAGRRDDQGEFPADSVNGRVEARLAGFAESIRSFAAGRQNGSEDDRQDAFPAQPDVEPGDEPGAGPGDASGSEP